MKQLLILLLACSLAACTCYGQTTKLVIAGTVVNDAGNPLEGVAVQAINGPAAITTKDGKFSLVVNTAKGIITLTHVGYQPFKLEVTTQSQQPIKITLKSLTDELEAVTVSTGYQRLPKERATGSFEFINKELFNRTVSGDILSRLDNVTSGLFMSKAGGLQGNIALRGLSTLGGTGTDPLIVLDDFPTALTLSEINPNDVENITVLKDAAATSIWGAQAQNGVIVITTKKAKAGKMKVAFNSNYSITSKPDLFYLPQISSSDFIDVEQYLFTNHFYDASFANTQNFPLVPPVADLLQQVKEGALSQQAADEKINAFRKVDIRDDWLTYLYQPAQSQRYSLGLSGGNAFSSYLFSLGYDNNKSTLVGSKDDRITLRADHSLRPLKGLEIRATVNYALSKSTSHANFGYKGISKTSVYPYASLTNADGSAAVVDKDFRAGYTDTAGGGYLLDWKYRPLDELNHNRILADNQNFVANTAIQYKLGAFTADVKYQFQSASGSGSQLQDGGSYYTRSYINRYTAIKPDGSVSRPVPLGGILDVNSSKGRSQSLRGQLGYNQSLGKHELSVIAGGEVRESKRNSNEYRVFGYDEENLGTARVDHATSYPLFGGRGNYTIDNNASFSQYLDRFVSQYANASYTYNRLYTLSASVRRDASNLFGVATNEKGRPFWSLGGAWNISEQAFYKAKWLPYLKLRTTYGFGGNVNNYLSAMATIVYGGNTGVTPFSYYQIGTPANARLRWEKTAMLNVGLDFRSAGQRVSGSVEWYLKRSTDLLAKAPLDPTTGYNTATVNSANMNGTGLDVTLQTVNLKGPLGWQTRFLFQYVTNKVTRYLVPVGNGKSYVGFGYNVQPLEGQDPFSLLGYAWGGLDPATGAPRGMLNGKPSMDYNTIINTARLGDLVNHGSTRPPLFGSVMNTFTYKNFNLSANITYRFNYYIRRSALSYYDLFNNWSGHSDFTKRWQKPGDELITNVPSLRYPAAGDELYYYSEAVVERGDLIRLQDIRLGYAGKARKYISDWQLYLYVNNVGLLWRANNEGIDPEYGAAIPAARSIAIGITAKF